MSHDRDYFLENFTMLITSGMDVFSALSILGDGTYSSRMKKTITAIKEDIDAGLPLWKALEKTHFLSGHALSLIQLGEKTGRLSENLKIIATQQKKEKLFQSTIRSAMLYPILILMVALIVVIGIMWFLLPHLAGVFSQLKIQLPLITRLLLSAGIFLRAYGIIALPIMCAISGLGIFLLFFFSKTKHIGQTLLFHVPGIRQIIQEIELSRFGSILGTLLAAGLPIVDALTSLRDTAGCIFYKKLYSHMAQCTEDGSSLQESLISYRKSSRLIPLPIQGILAASEKTGRLSEALLNIGSVYEEKGTASSKDISSLIEPVLLIAIWLGVLFVALAVILPIYRIIGGIQ